MKSFIILLLCAPLILPLTTSARNDRNRIYSSFGLSVYSVEDDCEFILDNPYPFPSGYVHFDANNHPDRAKGIQTIPTDALQQYLGIKRDVVEHQIGFPHADLGSGLYIPTYISDDAHLVFFLYDRNDTVMRIVKYDPLSNRIVFELNTDPTPA